MRISNYVMPIAMITMIICILSLSYIYITHSTQLAQTANSFCPKYAVSGGGILATPEYFCDGKKFICSAKECWYVE